MRDKLWNGAFILVVVVGLFWLGYSKGVRVTEIKYEAESSVQAKQTMLANALLHDHIKRVDEESTKELMDVQENLDRALDAVGSGRERLLVRTVRTKCAVSEGGNASGLGDGEGRSELHRDDAEKLFKLASKADRVAVQLRACQQALISNYQIINSPSGVEVEK